MNLIAKSTGITLATLFAVTGCGGGGSSSSSNSTPPANSTPVAITSSNGQSIAASVISNINLATSFTNSTPYYKQGSTTGATPHTGFGQAYELALTTALRALEIAKSAPATPAGVVNTVQTSPCTTSGSLSVTWNDANNNSTIDVGDSITATLSQCAEPSGTTTTTLNGSFSFTLNALQGDPTAGNGLSWSTGLAFAMNLTGTFSDTNGSSGSLSFNGGATLVGSYDQSTTITSKSMTGSSLKESISALVSGNTVNSSIELANFNFIDTNKSSDNSNTKSVNYTLRANEIGGSVTVVTNPVFAYLSGGYPTSGKMAITGANNTQIVVEAAGDGINAIITINSDAPLTVPWSSLIN